MQQIYTQAQKTWQSQHLAFASVKNANFFRSILGMQQISCLLFMIGLTFLSVRVQAQCPLFSNEIHYDDNGSPDSNEKLELAGDVGTSLTNWSVVFYNGANGQSYSTVSLSGTISNTNSCVVGGRTLGFVVIDLVAATGFAIQNGPPDGWALVNGTTVVEFFSYEGTFTATNGPANGLTSTDIGASETGAGTNMGSIQRTGAATWVTSNTTNTFAACNTTQYSPSCSSTPSVNLSVSTSQGAEVASTVVTVTASTTGAVSGAQTVTLAVTGTNVTAGDFTLSNTTITIPNGTTSGTVTFTVTNDVLVEGTETALLTISNPSAGITLGITTSQNITIFDNDLANGTTCLLFSNEAHYDNTGVEANEKIEIAGDVGTSLTGWGIVLYEGSNGAPYGATINLTGSIGNTNSCVVGSRTLGFNVVDIVAASGSSFGNGPDGWALVFNSTVVEFLSYEGVFAATSGPALGLTSTNIGASEDGTGAATGSIQRTGASTWTTNASTNTFGVCNTTQFACVLCPTLSATPTNTTCALTNGSVNLTVTGAGPFTYLWSNGATTEDLSGVAAATYTVTVTSSGCAAGTSTSVVVGATPDTQLPMITCPANIAVANATGQCSATVSYTAPVGTDNCPNPTTTRTSGLPSLATFPVGVTTNTFRVTDGAGNTATCAFTVTVSDTQLPTITCPANIAVANTTGQCSATVSYTDAFGMDNCPSPITIQTAGLASGSSFPVGVTTNTFRVTDGAGNTATCAFTVTVSDTQLPTITCPANIAVANTTGQCSATVSFTAPVGTDNCPSPVTTQTSGLPSGSSFPVGVTTNTFRVTDASSNTATCAFTITVSDTQLPTITCPANIAVANTTGQCSATVSYTAPVGTDNCPSPVTTQTSGLPSGSSFPVGVTTNTFRVTDASSNSATCAFTVTVSDTQLPTITCPANIAVANTTGQCSATVSFTAPVGTDNCSGPVTTQTSGLASGSSFPVGVTTNTFRVTDGAGNTATCAFTVTVSDTQLPTISCPANIAVANTTGQCSATVSFTAPVGTDNCPSPVTTQTSGLASGSSFPVGVTTNTFRVTDASSNSATCAFTVTVSDTQLPTISCPANIAVANTTGQCSAVVSYTAPVGTDNCPSPVTTQTSGLPSGSSFPVGVTTNTFRVTDASSNSATCAFTVTVSDTQLPTITCPANIAVANTTGQCSATVSYTAPVGTDNCPSPVTTQTSGLPSGSSFPVGVTTNTFRVTDASTNTATCAFTVTVSDTQLPTISCPANIAVANATGQCSAVVSYTAPVGTDNCSGPVTTQTSGLASGSSFPVGVTTNTFRVTDAATNSATCAFTVTVSDTQLPTISCPANIAVANTTGQCSAVVSFTAPVGTDNCSSPATTQTSGLPSGSSFPVGVTTNTFRVTDASTNTATCAFTVTVSDTQLPTITCPANIAVANTTGLCSAVVSYTTPVGTDNCSSPATTQTSGLPSGSSFPVGVTTNTFRVTDASTNTATCAFTVTVSDTQLPTITCPANIAVANTTGQCSAVVSYTAPVGTDNCPSPVTTQTSGLPSGSSFPVGVTTNTFRVTDASSNTATCAFTVTVSDTQLPTITCPANIAVANTTGQCSAVVSYTAPVGTDNCSSPATTQTSGLPSGSSFPVGVTTNTFRVTDGVGNSATCAFTVTVSDTQLPTITCPANIAVANTTNLCSAIVSYNTPVGADNCSSPATTQTSGLPSGSSFPVGVTTNTFRVTDASSNSATCAFTVTVSDTQLPTISCPANIAVANTTGLCSAVVSYNTPVGADNCSNPATTQTSGLPSGASFPVGVTTNTFRVTDGAGNTATCAFTVTVSDTELPTITCPANIAVANTTNLCSAIVSYTTPVGADNCSNPATIQTSGLPSGSTFPVGVTTNTFRVTDAAGNSSTCAFTVTVSDTQLPTITCPASFAVCFPTVPTYTAPVGTDNCSSPVTTQTSGLPSGGAFPIGPTVNVFRVTDASGNTATCSFTITVNPLPTPFSVTGGGARCSTDIAGLVVGLANSQTGVNYQLLLNNTNVGAPVAGTGAAISFAVQNSAGTYTVIATNVATGCTNTMTGSVAITIFNCAPSITDPCTCLNNATTLTNGQFGETITVNAPAGQTWTVSAVTGLFTSTSAAPPTAPTPITVGTVLTANGTVYTLAGRHVDAIGYTISITNGRGTTLTIGNNCQYPNPAITSNLDGVYCLFSAPVPLTGTPGDANIVSQGFTVNGVAATQFNPNAGVGLYTIVYTVNGGVPKAFGPNDPGCTQSVSKIVNVVATPSSVACNDLVQVSLEADCETVILPDMVLEGTYGCFDDYKVELDRTAPYGNGPWTTPIINASDIGKTYAVRVTHLVSGNSCWGLISIEDKLPPVLVCADLNVSCAEPNTSPSYLQSIGYTTAFPTVTDCQSTTRTWKDTWFDRPCGLTGNLNLSGYIERVWTVTDASGNSSTCLQTIRIVRINIGSIVFPTDYTTTNCTNAGTNPGITGAPTVPFTLPNGTVRQYPIWPESNYCEFNVTYTDQEIPVCDGTYKIIRTWIALDWCLPTSPFPPNQNPLQFIQVITVMDNAGPVIACPSNVTVSTDPFTCCATVNLPDVIITDNCSRINNVRACVIGFDPFTGAQIGTFNVGGSLSTFAGNNIWNPDTLGVYGITPCLPIGTHTVKYFAEDDCGNISECSFSLTIEDGVPPVVACDEFTQVGLGINGDAFINATTFDDGSYDNCGPVYFRVRRMDSNPCQSNGSFVNQAKFCCSDVNDTLTVILRVYDVDPVSNSVAIDAFEGHYNDCMVQVYVEDKIKPICTAPANVTVACETFDPSLWAYGKATPADNCCLDETKVYQGQIGLTHSASLTLFDTTCNRGTITRTFRAFDCYGNTSACTQRIVVTYNQNYWVKFPADRIVTVCDGSANPFGQPEFFGKDCELLATSYTDEVFTVVLDACYKIERTWTVINWCTYNTNLPCVYVPNPNPSNNSDSPLNLPGVTVSPLGTTQAGWAPTVVAITPGAIPTNYSTFWNANANCYQYKQIIKVKDGQDPTFVACPASPVQFCDITPNDNTLWNAMYWWDNVISSHDLCEGPSDLTITATDACSGSAISINYQLFLDLDGNGTMETVINSKQLPGVNRLVAGDTRQFDFRPVPFNQQYAFALQSTVTGNNRTASVRWNTLQNPNTYVVPELPYGTHKIKWTTEDGCGNESVCEYTFVVKDCKKPTVVCINGLSSNVGPTGVCPTIWATDFLLYGSDNCTPANQLKYSIRRSGTGTGFPVDANGQPITNISFNCADLGTQFVELWAIDKAGNADFCETYIIIQDNAGVCGGNATIAGALKTEEVEGVENANVELEGTANGAPAFNEVFSDLTGAYMFSNALPIGSNYTVTPQYDVDPLNGVTTYDLVLISRHILGLEPLNSPYKQIAADANKSNTITTFDVVELRKVILGINSDLPNNESWRFIDKTQVFTDPTNPFLDVLKENISVAQSQASQVDDDFVGVKIGDVNGSATANQLMQSDDRTAGTLMFDVEDRKVQAGDVFTINLTASEQVLGYQFTMNLDGLEVIRVEPGAGMSEDNFAVFNTSGAVTTSWDAPKVMTGKASYGLQVRATQSGQLSQMLGVSSRITKAQAYSPAASNLEVALRFNSGVISGVGFELYQNTPNPFVTKTFVGFHLPTAAEATLTLFDEMGRVIYTQKGQYAKGYNAIGLDRSVVGNTGTLYYELRTATDHATRKMIQLR